MDKKIEQRLKISNFKKYMASIILTTGITACMINTFDNTVDHTQEVCPLTNVLGLEHQIDMINSSEKNRQEKIFAYNSLRSILINSYDDYNLTYGNSVIVEQYKTPSEIIIPQNNRQIIKIFRITK
ncbi:MAG TPA: hypothetical protein PLV83_00790 [Bacilli bacterium]|nr:hypothetical protein [Bacilli bacterium]